MNPKEQQLDQAANAFWRRAKIAGTCCCGLWALAAALVLAAFVVVAILALVTS